MNTQTDPLDMKKNHDWTRIHEQKAINNVSIYELELVSFLEKEETSIKGSELQRRARTLDANIGFEGLKSIYENQDDIPKNFRKHKLPFPEVTWFSNPRQEPRMAILVYNKDYREWKVEYWPMSQIFTIHDRLLRPKRPSMETHVFVR